MIESFNQEKETVTILSKRITELVEEIADLKIEIKKEKE